MRIILVQAEIELALRAYVLNQIAVKDGQDISITFKNTRGDDGATAEIDITTPALVPNEPQKSTQTVVQSRSLPAATKIAQTTASAVLAPAVAATAPIASETEQSADTASTISADAGTKEETEAYDPPAFLKRETPTEPDNTVAEEPAPVTKPNFLNAQPAAAPADAPAASGKSLFANLTKPVNVKPEEH